MMNEPITPFLVVSPELYEQLKKAGRDMRYYIPNPPLPAHHNGTAEGK